MDEVFRDAAGDKEEGMKGLPTTGLDLEAIEIAARFKADLIEREE
jgi:hypothetical protein